MFQSRKVQDALREGYWDLSQEVTLNIRSKRVHKLVRCQGWKSLLSRGNSICTGSREGRSMVCKGDRKSLWPEHIEQRDLVGKVGAGVEVTQGLCSDLM